MSGHEGNVTVLAGVMVEVSGHEGNVTVLTGVMVVMVEVSGHEGNVTAYRSDGTSAWPRGECHCLPE